MKNVRKYYQFIILDIQHKIILKYFISYLVKYARVRQKSLAITINKLNFNIGIQNNYIAYIFKNLFLIYGQKQLSLHFFFFKSMFKKYHNRGFLAGSIFTIFKQSN